MGKEARYLFVIGCCLSLVILDILVTFSYLSYLVSTIIQGGFFDWSALKMTKCQTLRKF